MYNEYNTVVVIGPAVTAQECAFAVGATVRVEKRADEGEL